MSTPALALGTLLSSANSVKSTKNLVDIIHGVNQAQASGAIQEVQNVITSLGNASILMAPFKTVLAELQSSTVETTINLMTNLFKVMESPAGQVAIEGLSMLFNTIISNASSIVLVVDAIANFLLKIPVIATTFDLVVDSIENTNEKIKSLTAVFIEEMDSAMEDGKLNLKTDFEETNTLVRNGLNDFFKAFFEQIGIALKAGGENIERAFITPFDNIAVALTLAFDNIGKIILDFITNLISGASNTTDGYYDSDGNWVPNSGAGAGQ